MVNDIVSIRLVGPELGEEARVQRLTGVERISHLFDFELVIATAPGHKVEPVDVVGSEVTLVFERDGLEVRRIHGMIAELDDLAELEAGTRRFRIRVRPRAFRMTLVETQEVYLDRTVPEILVEKLGLLGLGDSVSLRLSRTYPKREFVTQYKETDVAFVSRLLEHEGISFFFEYDAEKDQDVLVVTDHAAGFATPEDAELVFHGRGERRGVYELVAEHRLTPSLYVVQDYNYRKALLDLTAEEPVPGGYGGGVVEYGTHHASPDEGKTYAKIRAEEQRARQLVHVGKTGHSHVGAGHRITVKEHGSFGDLDLLVVEVHHHVELVAFGTEGAASPYVATFRAVPRDRTYRPARVTPRPRIHGVVNGLVDDASRDVDKYAQLDVEGRYIIKLLYDTADASGRLASQWIRMAQPHAGPGYGMHFPLKPGVEVLLAFIDGDPDRPIIIGAVPNPVTPSPVDQASNTLNRIKSASGILIEYGDRRLAQK